MGATLPVFVGGHAELRPSIVAMSDGGYAIAWEEFDQWPVAGFRTRG
jgi:hypothetical protein